MKRTDNSRHSLVDFLNSIKFSREQGSSNLAGECHSHFARPQPLTRRKQRNEDAQLIRSAN
jgi:hypothetical protein